MPSRARVVAALLVGLFVGGAAVPSASAAPDDDWSLERSDSDPALVNQRFTKLRRNPLDRGQWRALERAIGREALGRKISAALARDPDDVALQVLDARLAIVHGKPRDAATRLAALEPRAGRLAGAVFTMRIDALEAAGELAPAVEALRARAAKSSGKSKAALLDRALGLADRGGLNDVAVELARAAADADPDDVGAHLRLARIAARAGDAPAADRAFEAAERHAKPRERDEIALERARARLETGDAEGAAAAIWTLLEDPRRGGRANRESRWELLVDANRRAGKSDVLAERLAQWLRDHDDEAAGWRALAAAQDAAGQDAQAARRRALALDPRDEDSQGALIDALHAKGDIDGAIAEYERFAARHPQDVERGLDLAGRLLQGPARERGLALARAIEARAAKRPQALTSLLEFYNLGDEPELALSVAHRLVKHAPRSADARLALGEQLFQMGRTPDALAQWALLPKLVHPAHRGWARHAEVLGEHGLLSDAIASLKVALKLSPGEPAYVRLRAVFAEEQRRPAVALELWQEVRALAKTPEHRLLRDEARTRIVELLVEGALPSRMEKLTSVENAARTQFERGEPLADAVEAGRLLAELHTRRELYAAAVTVHRGLVKLQPSDPDLLAELAGAQRRAGQPDDAIATLEQVLTLDPSRKAEVLSEVSELAFEAGDDKRALKAALDAADASGKQVDALVRLGELHERRGDLDTAAEAYARAMTAEPDDLRAYLHLADLEVTRAHDARARELLIAVLDKGGAAELVREAGRRVLDLAEADGDTLELLALAVRRTTRQPEAEEPREFLLAALERVDPRARTRWLGGSEGEARVTSLRASLLAALERGPIGTRVRAAEHLGALQLEDTAVPLVRAAGAVSAPRDATATVRDAYERLRVAALRAAGEQRDKQAARELAVVLDDRAMPQPARYAAAWGLTGVVDGTPATALTDELAAASDPVLTVLACTAAAHARTDKLAAASHRRVATLAREGRTADVRHACALAEAALAGDGELGKIAAQLDADDPVLAAIAAWRRGALARPDERAIQELFAAVLGPGGLRRDAAASALAHALRPATSTRMGLPPAPRVRNYAAVYERWLIGVLTPSFEPLTAKAIAPHLGAVQAALHANLRGSRAEREAATRAQRGCDAALDGARTQPATARTESSAENPPRERRERKHVGAASAERDHTRRPAAAQTRGDAEQSLCLSPLVGETLHVAAPSRD